MDVLVEGNRIVEVTDRRLTSATARVIEVKGRTLMPGLIDAHVHVIGVTTDLNALARMPPYLVAAQAKRVLEDMLSRGFTTVRDAGGAEWGLAEAVRQKYFIGPRLFVSGLGLAQTGGQGDFRRRGEMALGCMCCHATRSISRIVNGVDAVRAAVRDELRTGADQIKVYAAGGIVSGVPIHRAHFSVDELSAMVEEAEAADTYVMAHAYESRAVRRCVEAGARSIEHGNLIDRSTADLMASRGTYLVPTMSVFQAMKRHGSDLGLSKTAMGQLAELTKSAVEALALARSAGVKIGHGSDLEGILHQYQSDEFCLKAQVMTPMETIVAATATNAELMRMNGELGVIAAGALADIVVIDGNPLADLSLLGGQGAHMSLIMKDGVIYKDRLLS